MLEIINKLDANIPFEFTLFSVGFLIAIGATLIFTKKINKWSLGFSILFGALYHEINSLIYSLYSTYNGNNQVSTVAFLVVIPSILGVLLFFKKQRSMDRVFTFGIMTAVNLLWFVIHVSMISINLIDSIDRDVSVHEKAIAIFLKHDQKDVYYDYCHEQRLVCNWSSDKKDNGEFYKAYKSVSENENSEIHRVKYNPNTFPIASDDIVSKHYRDLGSNQNEHTFMLVYNKKTNVVASTFNFTSVQEIHGKTKLYFYTWFSLALVVWVYGGFSLLIFHKYRFRNRIKK
ncbi:TMEM14 family protein [Vibrio parahaemolyticus]|uniref:TMEM14 family protein n=1 Tax=Vibrio parahaemolyticus TaxID=670 RepID=UPI00387B09B1